MKRLRLGNPFSQPSGLIVGLQVAAPEGYRRASRYAQDQGPVGSGGYSESRTEVAMSEQEARRPDPRGSSRERSRDDVLAAAQPLPPDEDVLIGDLTEDEDRLFIAAVLDA
jgi:hypothetical protein